MRPMESPSESRCPEREGRTDGGTLGLLIPVTSLRFKVTQLRSSMSHQKPDFEKQCTLDPTNNPID